MYRTTIGLEIHVQLKTASKMFCRCSNDGEFSPPNTTVCAICLGHPGTLPVANRQAIFFTARMAAALHARINEYSKFDRKQYFYPDLPKGYQISQYDQPIGSGGYLDIALPNDNGRTEARIHLNRLHLEEDAAKLLHTGDKSASLVDFNRSSTPLMEIVTEPDLRSPLEAKIFLQELRLIARALDVSSADMEKGHLRCDANISVQSDQDGKEISTPISEIKNLNSFRAVEKALEYEAQRLYDDFVNGGEARTRTHKITVGWDDDRQQTALQRGKEDAHDYRYFPEPDLPPIHFNMEEIGEFESSIPELPIQRRIRLTTQYSISAQDARLYSEDEHLCSYFEQAASELEEWLATNAYTSDRAIALLSGIIINKLCTRLTERNMTIESCPITPENLAELVSMLAEQSINSVAAQVVLDSMFERPSNPREIVKERDLSQITDANEIERTAYAVIEANPEAVANYKKGKTNAIMFLVGQLMREMKGKAQPNAAQALLERLLSQ